MKLTVGIDATNIRFGGGRTHLLELLNSTDPKSHGISKIVVWGSVETLSLINDSQWIVKNSSPLHEKGLLMRTYWQSLSLSKEAREFECDVLLIPGGSFVGSFGPVVSISQNLLPFEFKELKRFGFSLTSLKLLILRLTQSRTFINSEGVIFLSNYARDTIDRIAGPLRSTKVIPHGVGARFQGQPKQQYNICEYSNSKPFRVIYVSTIDKYKHQWNVVEGVALLRETTGWNIKLDLIGSANSRAINRFHKSVHRYDTKLEWVNYKGEVSFDVLHESYASADLGIFASTCENMPNILLETMASGLPIACSNYGPMPEVLLKCGVYFDPESSTDIAAALRKLINSPEMRADLSAASFEQSKKYQWKLCASSTFNYIVEVAVKHKRSASLSQ